MTRTAIKVSLVHVLLVSLFLLLGWTVYQWFSVMIQFQGSSYNSGSLVVTFEDTTVNGHQLEFKRRIIAEPQGCRVVVYRYVIPMLDVNNSLYIGSYERSSEVAGDLEKRVVEIPSAIPPGDYLYFAKSEYYCTWLNRIFGPIKGFSIPTPFKITDDK